MLEGSVGGGPVDAEPMWSWGASVPTSASKAKEFPVGVSWREDPDWQWALLDDFAQGMASLFVIHGSFGADVAAVDCASAVTGNADPRRACARRGVFEDAGSCGLMGINSSASPAQTADWLLRVFGDLPPKLPFLSLTAHSFGVVGNPVDSSALVAAHANTRRACLCLGFLVGEELAGGVGMKNKGCCRVGGAD